MAADLYIHILAEEHAEALKTGTSIQQLYARTPKVWIGEASWLKASILGDKKSFIPDPVNEVEKIVGKNFPTIDDEFVKKISAAMRKENKSNYSIADPDDVINFLRGHKGRRAFAVKW